ncbi:MAG: hypothetical protein K8R92_02395 [Planctomycetes bacterium]|nr:hypothetical protein [Planctomycetota bacterium]
MTCKSYSGSNELDLLRQAKAENPDGFEILSIKRSGFLWWRKVTLLAQPLTRAPRQEMNKLRLLAALHSIREQRQQQSAQRDVFTHSHDFIKQQRR